MPNPLGAAMVDHTGLLPGHEELCDCWGEPNVGNFQVRKLKT